MENDIYMIINDTSYDVTNDNGNANYCVVLYSYCNRNKLFIPGPIPKFQYNYTYIHNTLIN